MIVRILCNDTMDADNTRCGCTTRKSRTAHTTSRSRRQRRSGSAVAVVAVPFCPPRSSLFVMIYSPGVFYCIYCACWLYCSILLIEAIDVCCCKMRFESAPPCLTTASIYTSKYSRSGTTCTPTSLTYCTIRYTRRIIYLAVHFTRHLCLYVQYVNLLLFHFLLHKKSRRENLGSIVIIIMIIIIYSKQDGRFY